MSTDMTEQFEVPAGIADARPTPPAPRPRRSRRALVGYIAGVTALAAGMAVAGAAAAYYTIGGASTAIVHVGDNTAPVEAMAGSAADLGPGDTVVVPVQLSNPGTEPLAVVQLEPEIPDRVRGCQLESGLLDVGLPADLPTLAPGESVRIQVLVTMSEDAPERCQNVPVPITLAIRGVTSP